MCMIIELILNFIGKKETSIRLLLNICRIIIMEIYYIYNVSKSKILQNRQSCCNPLYQRWLVKVDG